MKAATPIRILLIEDNEGDVRLVQEALREGCILNDLIIKRDGEEARDYFRKLLKEDVIDLILLDLNLPRLGGIELLKILKDSDSLRQIPVVVLTSSSAEEDIVRSYDLHANCYITKPVDFEQFVKVVKTIEDFWISIVKLPTRSLDGKQ